MKAIKLTLSFILAFGFLFGLTAQKSEATHLSHFYSGGHHPSIFIVNLGNRRHHKNRRHHRKNRHVRCYSFHCGGHNYGASIYRRHSRQIVKRTVIRVSVRIRKTVRVKRVNHTCLYGCGSHSYGGYYHT